jgi:MraZ protein
MGHCGVLWREVGQIPMSVDTKRIVFVGTFTHSVDDKKRVAIPAKWRAAASGSNEFCILPGPKQQLVVLPQPVVEKMMEKADEMSIFDPLRATMRVVTSEGHTTPCDKTGRIVLNEALLRRAGITNEAVLVGMFNQFEIWAPERYAADKSAATHNLAEAAQQLGI